VDLVAIRNFYANCPAGYEVDHIIPLKGRNVSGLHVLENLQYIPAELNRSKGNRVPLNIPQNAACILGEIKYG
jgi:hypothetical protein